MQELSEKPKKSNRLSFDNNDPSNTNKDPNSSSDFEKINVTKIPSSAYTKISTDDDLLIDPSDIKITKEQIISSSNYDFQASPITIDKSEAFCFRKIGNMLTFFGDRNGDPLIMIGPHWPMFVCFSSFVSVGMFLFFRYLWNYMHWLSKIIGISVYLFYIISYSYTALINPGYPKHNIESKTGEPRTNFRFCGKCKIWISNKEKAEHCFDCNICVEGFDHHCPWTGKCIGKRNLLAFYCFIISILVIFTYFVVALVNAQTNLAAEKKDKRLNNNNARKLWSVGDLFLFFAGMIGG